MVSKPPAQSVNSTGLKEAAQGGLPRFAASRANVSIVSLRTFKRKPYMTVDKFITTETNPEPAKARRTRYDVLRILAAFMVIGAHFDTHLPDYLNIPNYPRALMNGLGTFLVDGGLAVAIFFMLSGFFSCSSVRKESFQPAIWIRQRIKRLLIPMWVAWPMGLALMVLIGRATAPTVKEIILAVVGMDGYIGPYLQNPIYGVVGEWYTGAVIVVTFLWPLVRKLMQKHGIHQVTLVIVLAEIAFGLALREKIDLLGLYRSPLVCLASYCVGCSLAKLSESPEGEISPFWPVLAICLLVAGEICHHGETLVGDALARTLGYQFTAMTYFCFAEAVARLKLPKTARASATKCAGLITRLAALSYPFYLFQHVSIYFVLGIAGTALGPEPRRALLGAALLVLTCCLALALSVLEEHVRRRLVRALSRNR